MTDPLKSRTIRLFLADGHPSGVRTVEIMSSWTGKMIVGGRNDLPELVRREEASKTGIYFLVGPDPEAPQRSKVYVGEGDSVKERLKKHNTDAAKDFFNSICFVISKDENLTKAHARYLESRFIEIIKASGRASLANGTEPAFSMIPESDRADMEFFIAQVRLLLPVLGFDIAKDPATIASPEGKATTPPSPVFRINSVGVDARMSVVDNEYVVHQESTARADAKSASNTYRQLRDQLIKEGKLVTKPGSPELLQFTEAVPFASLSAAAATILDRNAQGPREWKLDGEKTTYAEWQQAQLDV